ncbi:hypothetical protein H6P81_006779 [Aristolochia fimbriata]|uniref:Uncharacterized protein n=1 Tax=Aristolochia fimbriata TaxID=158543 RepID=A0AAV7EY90_ARIFI|nr:hypothetical protein H6P81_006779 [Aristolochia fimbriata]
MPESRRNVPFDEEVAVPGATVAEERSKQYEPPFHEQGVDQQKNGGEGAKEMPTTSQGLGVLADVEGPELFHTPEVHIEGEGSESRVEKAKSPSTSGISLRVLEKP